MMIFDSALLFLGHPVY